MYKTSFIQCYGLLVTILQTQKIINKIKSGIHQNQNCYSIITILKPFIFVKQILLNCM